MCKLQDSNVRQTDREQVETSWKRLPEKAASFLFRPLIHIQIFELWHYNVVKVYERVPVVVWALDTMNYE